MTKVEDIQVTVLAGHLRDDFPNMVDLDFDLVGRKVYRLGAKTGFFSCISWSMVAEIFRQVRRADLIHVSFARELVPLITAGVAIVLRRPLVVQPHGMLTSRTSRLHQLVDLIARPMFRMAGRAIALTRVEEAQLEEWAGVTQRTMIDVIGNPLPYVAGVGQAPTGSSKALFIARLEPRKRVSDFVEARQIANSRGWEEEYEVVGPDQGDAAAVISAAASTPGLTYRGAVPASSIEAILDTAGVFVLTSENEPWGNVLVAALAREIPVVVTQSAALATEIEDNHLGIVVPDRDPPAVAEAVHRIVTSPWRTTEDSGTAKAFARVRFDQAAIGRQLLSTYHSARGENATDAMAE
ncbi:Glycosyltransferase involved in cell wall bisynthesis [Arthrobacter sp. ok909]|uniref:glycosyltransferase family 4 protein n=1 Tax=Arthrobacter sp. ok909 TaxID=1761746 RepID=UPI00088A3043|nr:glycosyltransferase family 4 protein [Arthrobacter sp. ok909]SDP25112.1 Glycosyltransferase involved in cell wall bisynthesis [Arthrobacter sp. ok909]